MNPQIMIIASGEALDLKKAQAEISSIPGLAVETIGPDRGFKEGAIKVLKCIAGFMGDSSKLTDLLIDKASGVLAGSSLEVQVGTTVIKISGVNRSQVVELLDKAAKIAKDKGNL